MLDSGVVRAVVFTFGLVLAALAMHCGGDDAASNGASGGSSGAGGTGRDPAAAPSGAAEGNGAERETVDPMVAAVSKCIDDGGAPRECLAKSGAAARDLDEDGLDDVLEDAMLRSYAPVFAFNQGDGNHTAGNDESHYPTNLAHYVKHSTLYWRVDGNDGTKKVVDENPTLDKLSAATFEQKRASSVAIGEGPNFWLCLKKDAATGDYASDALVKSMEASRKLEGGVDVLGVVHPTSKGSDYVVLSYMLFYSYNAFTFDDHEGDFEGGAVFVSLSTGQVVALYTDRHPSSDNTTLIPIEGNNRLPAFDPKKEVPKYNICSDTSASPTGGVRFWDFEGKRHHPVIYVSSGGHAAYGYPGGTKIQGLGCMETTMIRDVHNGNGPKLVIAESTYSADWEGKRASKIEGGVHIKNIGERDHLREKWTEFAGQWGCTLESIPKSYPGPWDNERLCRHWLTNDWGGTMPFKESDAKSCTGE